MYNRYIPQPDGSYRRSRIPDKAPPTPAPQPKWEEPQQQEEEAMPYSPQPEAPCQQGQPCPHAQRTPRQSQPRQSRQQGSPIERQGVGGFLKQLLPKDFDTEDLLIVLLLLLMSGDCAEDQNSALLTLALYLFM